MIAPKRERGHLNLVKRGHYDFALSGVQFALTWSAISTIIFVGTRMYYVSRGRNCPLCNDLPEIEKDASSKTHS